MTRVLNMLEGAIVVLFLALVMMIFTGCSAGYRVMVTSVTDYKIRGGEHWPKTPKGIGVLNSTAKQRAEIDRRVDALEACLGRHIVRKWLHVYIAPNAERSPCTGKWLLPYPAPPQSCKAKGLAPSPHCPCRWRGALQNGHYIVIVPSLETLELQVAKLVFGRVSPHLDPAVGKCL